MPDTTVANYLKDAQDIRNHIDSLAAVLAGPREPTLAHLYDCLTILDTKSSSLLAVNSILAAGFAIFIAPPGLALPLLVVLGAGVTAVGGSSWLLLKVVKVEWSTKNELDNVDELLRHFLELRGKRTEMYAKARLLTLGAMIGMAGAFLLKVVAPLLP